MGFALAGLRAATARDFGALADGLTRRAFATAVAATSPAAPPAAAAFAFVRYRSVRRRAGTVWGRGRVDEARRGLARRRHGLGCARRARAARRAIVGRYGAFAAGQSRVTAFPAFPAFRSTLHPAFGAAVAAPATPSALTTFAPLPLASHPPNAKYR